MKAFAIHTIHRKPDPKGEVEVIPAGDVFDATEEELDVWKKGSLAAAGAIRPATAIDEARCADRVIDPLALQSLQTDGGETGTGGAGDFNAPHAA